MTFLLGLLLLQFSAEDFFQATLFDKAQEAYFKEDNREKEVESLFLQKRFKELLKRFKSDPPKGKEILWLALSYENLGELDKSQHLKNLYFETDNSLSLEEKIAFFLTVDHPEKAYPLLQKMPETPEVLHTLIELKKRDKASPTELNRLRKRLLSLTPITPYHAEATFELYSFQDYLMGEKEALTHLKNFVEKYPKSPFSIVGHYLIGLDYKKDRKPAGGRRAHFKNPDKALEALSSAEKNFEELSKDLSDKPYWQSIYIRAKLERADLLIEQGQGKNPAKKALFYTQAIDVLKDMPQPEAILKLAGLEMDQGAYPIALEELARLSNEESALINAKKALLQAKAYYRLNQPKAAFNAFPKTFPDGLENDEVLNAKILKSLIFKEMKDYDNAKLLLSEVINSDLVSSCRIKAMCIRAFLYEQEGRQKLAERQYESAFQKGGKWAQESLSEWKKEFFL